ncbi:hypothetical protein J6590_058375 [Homalodisca vitripennis]|nr:hypothetical protein J6590_058375 [Homalodisca vitripennis]
MKQIMLEPLRIEGSDLHYIDVNPGYLEIAILSSLSFSTVYFPKESRMKKITSNTLRIEGYTLNCYAYYKGYPYDPIPIP